MAASIAGFLPLDNDHRRLRACYEFVTAIERPGLGKRHDAPPERAAGAGAKRYLRGPLLGPAVPLEFNPQHVAEQAALGVVVGPPGGRPKDRAFLALPGPLRVDQLNCSPIPAEQRRRIVRY